MIPYYEELNDEEKNAVTKVIRTLLICFIIHS